MAMAALALIATVTTMLLHAMMRQQAAGGKQLLVGNSLMRLSDRFRKDVQMALEARIDSGETRNVSLANRMPVILHYWTVNPDDDGALSFRPDIYERDDELLHALDRPLAL